MSAVLLYTTFQNKFPRVLSRASVSECRGQYRQEARAVTRQPAPSRGPTYERGNSRLWLDIVLPLALLTRGEEKRGKLEKRVGSQYRAGIVRVVAVLLVDLVRHGLYQGLMHRRIRACRHLHGGTAAAREAAHGPNGTVESTRSRLRIHGREQAEFLGIDTVL